MGLGRIAKASGLGLAKAQYSGSGITGAGPLFLLNPDASASAAGAQTLPLLLGAVKGLSVAALPVIPGVLPAGVGPGQQAPTTEVTINSLCLQTLGSAGNDAGTVLTATLYVQRMTATSNAPNPTSYAAPVLAPVSTGISVALTLAATATVQQAWSAVPTQGLSPTPPSGGVVPFQVQPGDTYYVVLGTSATLAGTYLVQVAVG